MLSGYAWAGSLHQSLYACQGSNCFKVWLNCGEVSQTMLYLVESWVGMAGTVCPAFEMHQLLLWRNSLSVLQSLWSFSPWLCLQPWTHILPVCIQFDMPDVTNLWVGGRACCEQTKSHMAFLDSSDNYTNHRDRTTTCHCVPYVEVSAYIHWKIPA